MRHNSSSSRPWLPPLSESRGVMDSALYRFVTYSFTRLPCNAPAGGLAFRKRRANLPPQGRRLHDAIPRRAAFPADPRPHQRAGQGAAGDRQPHHRPPWPGFRPAGAGDPQRPAQHLPDQGSRGDLSRLRHRRLGSGADQHPVAGRHGADVPHRLVRHLVERDGAAARPQADLHRHRLAAWRRRGGDRRRAG